MMILKHYRVLDPSESVLERLSLWCSVREHDSRLVMAQAEGEDSVRFSVVVNDYHGAAAELFEQEFAGLVELAAFPR